MFITFETRRALGGAHTDTTQCLIRENISGPKYIFEQEKGQSEIADPHQDFFSVVYFKKISFWENMAANHVTNDITCVNLLFLMDRWSYV